MVKLFLASAFASLVSKHAARIVYWMQYCKQGYQRFLTKTTLWDSCWFTRLLRRRPLHLKEASSPKKTTSQVLACSNSAHTASSFSMLKPGSRAGPRTIDSLDSTVEIALSSFPIISAGITSAPCRSAWISSP